MLRPASPSNAIVWSRKRVGPSVAGAWVMGKSFRCAYLAPLAGRGAGRLWRPSSRTPKRSFGYGVAPGEGDSPRVERVDAAPHPNPLPAKSGEREERSRLRRHPVQRTELVAVRIAQIGDVQ